jgi:CheY-like chemotaxis protein
MKILIADDSLEMRRCVREMVSPGHEFIECTNGHEVTAAFAACQPDWVLMDIEMPGQDGLTAARQIRAEFPKAKIIFVTAFDERRLRTAASLLGQGYVLKHELEQINRIIENPHCNSF